jgi:hypothetical protein
VPILSTVRHHAAEPGLKRALPRLKVEQLWEAPVSRNAFE